MAEPAPSRMTVAEFLAWDDGSDARFPSTALDAEMALDDLDRATVL